MQQSLLLRFILLLCVCAALTGHRTAPAVEPPAVTIKLSGKPSKTGGLRVDVLGLTSAELDQLRSADRLSDILAVYTIAENGKPSSTRVFGECRVAADRLTFVPRFEFVPDGSYLARLSLGKLSDHRTRPRIEARLRIPPLAPRAPGHVTQVYPTASVLAENTLKFYIHFSVPMSRGQAYRRIRLVRASGERVDFPFLELDEELWDPSGKRFTLFFDPGRIKRGLKPREEFGPVLEEGSRYTLIIDDQWPDDRGQSLAAPFRKPFRVIAPDDVQPDHQEWDWQVPAAGTKGPLTMTFREPLDHALLQRVLVVLDSAEVSVPGEVTVFKSETVWSFRPQTQWRAGEYSLAIDTGLEDRSGNSIGRPFEVDVFRTVEKEVKPQWIKVPFQVK